ncbi:MAG: galactose mutarotase [Bacteroidetes bacterium]|nr:MAG: galactose mutarotase [Bacteroidota bacterium]
MPTDLKPSLFPNSFVFGNIYGKEVTLFNLKNKSGVQLSIINYGAAITQLLVPDRNGILADIVLGFDDLDGYLQKGNRFFGAVVGRYANRIAQGRVSIHGTAYQLSKNRGEHSIHGGYVGFDKVIWKILETNGTDFLKLSYESRDGEEGFPGNLNVTVSYSLSADNALKIEYAATTDKPTIINLTNHSYFNLYTSGQLSILDHELMINAGFYTEVNEDLIPTGKILDVKGGPLDFNSPKVIGRDIALLPTDYDHNIILNNVSGAFTKAAELYHAPSGRCMEVFTNQPGMQFYSGNFLDGSLKGKSGKAYGKYSGLCLETQHYPDSPNHQNFPSTTLLPGQTYSHITSYNFSVR